ncbi:hypothetical protein DA075_08545 [Methylobacterium currus]|uniref:Schlafen AlbA-2 domain-containing protein n=1 Tax=Methylobacterium currus TaxID=2051553 RepID=A0A2R4WT96_9HYPH|nr:ATP-binding protein [Methylobacterium currus]AWB24770.1 hypothetical protein DA075_08545 [Methylobacterium currus]
MQHTRHIAIIDELLNLPAETTWVEFKNGNEDPDRIGKTISALANGARLADRPMGYLVWGVEDANRTIVGTQFEPSTASGKGSQPLEIWLGRMVDPCPALAFHVIPHPQGRVVLLEIPPATHAPVAFERQAYIRIGSSVTRLSDHRDREKALWAKLQTFAWEQGIAIPFITSEEVISTLDYPSYFTLTNQPLPESADVILNKLQDDRLIDKDAGGRWNILNLGAILFSRQINSIDRLSRKAVRVVDYEGRDRTRTRRRWDMPEGYASGFANLLATVNSMLPANEHIGQAFREERRVYPEIAVRELVANALIHQDMTVSGAGPTIEIFADRIEITNPGAPLNEPRRLIDLPPRSRNESLASLTRRMRMCEEGGTGLDKVVASAELYQLPAPDFRAESDNMRVVMFAPRGFGEMTAAERIRAADQHATLCYLSGSRMTNTSLRQRLGIAGQNAAQASRIIKEALALDLIRPADPAMPRAGYIPGWA